jgi:hypothetical protein
VSAFSPGGALIGSIESCLDLAANAAPAAGRFAAIATNSIRISAVSGWP